MDKVIVIGAIDRHNYGDLLFPILITEYLKQELKEDYLKLQIEYYGSVNSNLSAFGAIKTESCNELFNSKVTDKTVVVVVGGAVLFATWINIISYLKSDLLFKVISVANKLIPSDILERLLAKTYGFKIKKPFIIPKEIFLDAQPKITYNAVGASGLSFVSQKSRKYLSNSLNYSDFLSVRDQKSYDNLIEIGVTKEFFVSPDSALIMSDYFPIVELERKVEKATLDLVNKFGRDYFCFQVGLKYAKNNYNVIAKNLDEISLKHNLPILLLPIGNAPGHSNDIALKKILSTMKSNNVEILKSSNVYDIMLAIAVSRVFAGTSLHGNITATSFNVQSIILTSEIPKLNNYVKTWLDPDVIHIVEFNDLYDTFSVLMDNGFNGYKNLDSLKNKVYENYKSLFSLT